MIRFNFVFVGKLVQVYMNFGILDEVTEVLKGRLSQIYTLCCVKMHHFNHIPPLKSL